MSETLSLNETFVQASYLAAAILFILGLQNMGKTETARRGIRMAELGMFFAVVGTLIDHQVVSYTWIIISMVIGSAIGTAMGLLIPMVKMPERIALSHAFGGLAVSLVGVSEYLHRGAEITQFQMAATGLEVFLGALTFTGSLMAFGKLQGTLPGKPVTWPLQNVLNVLAVFAAVLMVVYLVVALNPAEGSLFYSLRESGPAPSTIFYTVLGLGTVLGVTLVLPIGGADMPVVICLLNAYAGLAASATGFALNNNVLIICGALDGGSGIILGMMMSKNMNRSFSNVMFGAVGGGDSPQMTAGGAANALASAANVGSVEDAADVLSAARSVIIVPGYGMAVSQAQHIVRDLANALSANGAEVRYAIHPVAGRMPGHMNVLLAEANVPYDQLFDLDAINDDFASTDVAIVVGANDVVNPAAKTQTSSPIYGMPVLAVDAAKTAIVFKRSFNPGFAGIENELFTKPSTMMVLGDAKKSIASLVAAVKGEGGAVKHAA